VSQSGHRQCRGHLGLLQNARPGAASTCRWVSANAVRGCPVHPSAAACTKANDRSALGLGLPVANGNWRPWSGQERTSGGPRSSSAGSIAAKPGQISGKAAQVAWRAALDNCGQFGGRVHRAPQIASARPWRSMTTAAILAVGRLVPDGAVLCRVVPGSAAWCTRANWSWHVALECHVARVTWPSSTRWHLARVQRAAPPGTTRHNPRPKEGWQETQRAN
jgi:hypothetical protein